MTELEKIAYAKSFIDKLAIGVNPTDGTLIPDGEAATNPRISKCFFYVSEILSRVIDNPTIGREMNKNADWVLTPQVLAKIEISDSNITLSSIAKKINIALNATTSFTRRELSGWLIAKGYMLVLTNVGLKPLKRPTPKGLKIGIMTEEVVSPNGETKYRVKCSPSAQEFIKNNLGEILAFAKAEMERNAREKKNRDAVFSISMEELSRFEYSSTPLMISQIADKISSLKKSTNGVVLAPTKLTAWLCEKGLLQSKKVEGRLYRFPTEKGESLGISIENRKRNGEEYSVCLYDLNMQRFIIDNIYEIINID